jgi:hypothetical protein
MESLGVCGRAGGETSMMRSTIHKASKNQTFPLAKMPKRAHHNAAGMLVRLSALGSSRTDASTAVDPLLAEQRFVTARPILRQAA